MDLNTVNMIAASRVVKTKPTTICSRLFALPNHLSVKFPTDNRQNSGLRVLPILLGFKSHRLFALLALSEVTCQAGN